MAGEEYLGWPRKYIADFLRRHKVKKVCFIPYAGVSLSKKSLEDSYGIYTQKVAGVFDELGYELESVHQADDPVKIVHDAEAIVVGGGNTFYLVAALYDMGLMEVIREKVIAGTPYMGWSAGSNVACPTLMTTNDMPIVEPRSFKTLNFIPFQINPHYLDTNPLGHGGETRQQRIEEFLVVNQNMKVAGLREGCLLQMQGAEMQLIGGGDLRLFQFGKEPVELVPGADLSLLFE